MAAEVMMSLGDYLFSLDTAAYQKLQRSSSYKWAAQDRFGQGQALQYVGWENETMSLDGIIYPEFRGGHVQLDEMRAMAKKGIPLTLVTGTGFVLGEWCITDIEEVQSNFFGPGVAQRIDFKMGLKRYDGEDRPQSDFAGGTGNGPFVPGETPTEDWGGVYDPGPLPGEVQPKRTVAETYISRAGDTLAALAQRYYGSLNGRVVERLYEKNPGLASVGAVIPGGVKVELPPLPTEAAKEQFVRLWS